MKRAMPTSAKTRTPRVFTAEFKQGAVRLVIEEQRSIKSVSDSLGIGSSTLGKWVRKAKASGAPEGGEARAADNAEIARLKRALREAEMERDILKKATAFFAKQST